MFSFILENCARKDIETFKVLIPGPVSRFFDQVECFSNKEEAITEANLMKESVAQNYVCEYIPGWSSYRLKSTSMFNSEPATAFQDNGIRVYSVTLSEGLVQEDLVYEAKFAGCDNEVVIEAV